MVGSTAKPHRSDSHPGLARTQASRWGSVSMSCCCHSILTLEVQALFILVVWAFLGFSFFFLFFLRPHESHLLSSHPEKCKYEQMFVCDSCSPWSLTPNPRLETPAHAPSLHPPLFCAALAMTYPSAERGNTMDPSELLLRTGWDDTDKARGPSLTYSGHRTARPLALSNRDSWRGRSGRHRFESRLCHWITFVTLGKPLHVPKPRFPHL